MVTTLLAAVIVSLFGQIVSTPAAGAVPGTIPNGTSFVTADHAITLTYTVVPGRTAQDALVAFDLIDAEQITQLTGARIVDLSRPDARTLDALGADDMKVWTFAKDSPTGPGMASAALVGPNVYIVIIRGDTVNQASPAIYAAFLRDVFDDGEASAPEGFVPWEGND